MTQIYGHRILHNLATTRTLGAEEKRVHVSPTLPYVELQDVRSTLRAKPTLKSIAVVFGGRTDGNVISNQVDQVRVNLRCTTQPHCCLVHE